jgi:hypothetical protein
VRTEGSNAVGRDGVYRKSGREGEMVVGDQEDLESHCIGEVDTPDSFFFFLERVMVLLAGKLAFISAREEETNSIRTDVEANPKSPIVCRRCQMQKICLLFSSSTKGPATIRALLRHKLYIS